MNVEIGRDILDGVVPYTEPLKDKRRVRVKSCGRPPSQYFLKENILHLDEESEDKLENDIKATGDSENTHQTDSVPRTRPISLGLRSIPSNEDVKTSSAVTTPPWLEELRKKKQSKLQKNSSESILKKPNEESNIHEQSKMTTTPTKQTPTSTTSEESQEEVPWVGQLRKKKHITEEEPINKTSNRVVTNTILVVNNSTKNTPRCSSATPTNLLPVPCTTPASIISTENFVHTTDSSIQNDQYLDDFEDDAEIMEVMSPVNLDKKLSVREMENDIGPITSRPSMSDVGVVFDEVCSITLVKPLTRSESLNRHNLRTYGHNGPGNFIYKPKSTENISSDSFGNDQKSLRSDTKLRFLRIIEQMENIVNKNAVENQTIKNELEAVIEENKLLSKSLDILKAEIGRL